MDAQNPTNKTSEATSKKITKSDYALATFIMGCLVNEQVVPFDNSSDAWSDLQCGIQIVAACLQNYDKDMDGYHLPFEW